VPKHRLEVEGRRLDVMALALLEEKADLRGDDELVGSGLDPDRLEEEVVQPGVRTGEEVTFPELRERLLPGPGGLPEDPLDRARARAEEEDKV